MKAIVVEPGKSNSVRLTDIDKPKPSKGQVLLDVLCIGIDGTDREINEGAYGQAPEGSSFLVIGHEALARVSEVGEYVLGFNVGELVVPTVRRPGNCPFCQAGEASMCPVGDYSEHGILKSHGFASEYAVSDANFLVKVPSELQDIAVLLEPLSVAEKAISHAFLAQKRMTWMPKRAFVLGAGPLGLLATMILRLKGLEVDCTATQEKDSLKAKIVEEVGANYINAKEIPILSIKEKYDLIIEATGNVEVAIDSLHVLRSNGVLCLLGIYPDKHVCQDFGKILTNMVFGNRLIIGSVNSDKVHFEIGIKHMIEITKRFGNVLERMLTVKLSPEEFKKAFTNEDEIKTIICFE